MLTEKSEIDQLFRSKLGEYEKTPPASAWINIQEKLDSRAAAHRRMIRKMVSMAAVMVLALLAGWWFQNPIKQNDAPENSLAEKVVIEKNLNAARFAAFAPTSQFTKREVTTTMKEKDEMTLPDSETAVLNKLDQKLKVVKEITGWIAAKRSNDTVPASVDSKSQTNAYKAPFITDKQIFTSLDIPNKINKRWSLKAEIAPLFNGQMINDQQKNTLQNGSMIVSPQNTTAENTYSAGILAGYKLTRRLTLKSGIVYNTIRHSTRNINLAGSNPLFNSPGNIVLATTPAGQVRLQRKGNPQTVSELNSNVQTDNSQSFSAQSVLKQNFDFVELPLMATYKLIDRKLDIGITGGINAGMLIGNKATLLANGNQFTTGETAGLRNIVYSGVVGLELGYEITNRITLTIEPRLNRYINSLNTSKSANYKPYQIGVATGLTYSFN